MPERNERSVQEVEPKRGDRREEGATRERLHETEQWLRMLIDSAEDYAIFALTLDGKVATWSKGAEKLFGYTEEEVCGQSFSIIFTPEDRAAGAPAQELTTALRDGHSADERWHVRKDGTRFFVSGSVRTLKDRAQRVHGLLKVARDVTEQMHAQTLEEQFRALFESAPGAFLVLTPRDFRIAAVSDAYLAATMTERAGIIGRPMFEVFPDDPSNPRCDAVRSLQASFERVQKQKRRDVMPVQYYPVPRPPALGGGFEERWWSPVNTPVLGPKGEVTHIIHRVEDLTPFILRQKLAGKPASELQASPDQRMEALAQEIILRGEELERASEELRRSRAELESVFQTMQGGVMVADPAGNLVMVNEAQARIGGYDSPEAMKKNLSEFREQLEFREPDGAMVPFERWPLARVLRGETLTDWQLRGRRRDTGQEWFFSFSGQPVRDDKGTVILATVVTRDVTRSKQAEAALRLARDELARTNQDLERRVKERTATLSETVEELEGFSYSLSHDMRAPLRAMHSFAEILLNEFGEKLGTEGTDLLQRIVAAASRLDDLIQDVLTLARLSKERFEPHPVDVERLLQQIVQERKALQPPRADVTIERPLLKISGHEASLTQCLTNLLDNAVKFVAEGVHPRVRVWTEADDSRVRIWVEDNGIGIEKQHESRIFKMFERLHAGEKYQGTGIGLAIVRKAAERMGGCAGVESEPGRGSRFWLDLPRADEQRKDRSAATGSARE